MKFFIYTNLQFTNDNDGNSGVGTMGTGGYIVPPKFRTCTPCTSQVKDAAYVKILSKRLKLQDCIRFVQICTPPTYENVPTRLDGNQAKL